MWQTLKYFLTFGFLTDFKAGQNECEDFHKRLYEQSMRRQFLTNMVKSNEEDDELGLVD